MRKTAEERFNMLARGWLAYPVTPTHHPSTAEERLYMSSLGLLSLVAERRHSSITRYAKRSVACRDSPRHQTLRAGGTPLPHLRRLPHHIVRHHPSYCAVGAIHHHRRKTAEERFHTLARGWLAYPVTPTHLPSTAEERLYKRHPIGLPRPVTPCAIRRERSLRFPEAPLFALINYCFSYSITFCALPSTTTT